MKITNEMIEQVYISGKRIYRSEITLSDAKAELTYLGMNGNSAHKYLTAILAMLDGSQYGSTINSEATEYFLKNILTDFGSKGLTLSLDALKSHLEYQDGKNNLPGLWSLFFYYKRMNDE